MDWTRFIVPPPPPPRHDFTAEEDAYQEVREHGIKAKRTNQEPCRRNSSVRKKNQLWTKEDMKATLEDFDSGMSKKNSAMSHGIPYSTFREWCYGVRRTWRRGPRGVLSLEEEEQIVEYLVIMYEMGLELIPIALKMKVYEITRHRSIPFKNGILGDGWLQCFKHCHLELTLRVAQALEASRARGLSKENVPSFYDILNELYTLHMYPAECIWNCDEIRTQAGRIGGGIVIARRGACCVYTIVPNQR
jgi:hypothetical protein